MSTDQQAAADVEPALREMVERFFATQQNEDAAGYLALWASSARAPQAQQLQYIFDSGQDTFLDLRITHATITDTSARLRASVLRSRTDVRVKHPDGSPRLVSTALHLTLTFVRENGAWKLFREAAPVDELAAALTEQTDPVRRAEMLEAEKDLVNVRLVEALGRRADDLAQKLQFSAARDVYERAIEVARAAGDRKAEGQSLQNIANTHYYQRDYEKSRAAYEARLALEREIANDDGVASAVLGLATLQYTTYEYSAALKLYREALEIQERLGDQSAIATILISTGNVLYMQGDYEGAIADYRRAEALKREYLDPSGAATALEGLGRVYSAQGDYAAALTAFAGVLDERRRLRDTGRQPPVLQSIGEIHFRLGNTDQARAVLEEARLLLDKAQNLSGVGRVLQVMGVNELVAGRLPAAEKAYTQSIAACTPAKDGECVARAQVGLAFALSAQQKYPEAIASYRWSIAGFRALSLTEPAARAQVGLAEALTGKGDFEDALEAAAAARHAAVSGESDDLLWRALIAQARAERKMGRSGEALGAARAALAAIRRMAAAALERPGQAVPRDTTSAFATTAVLQAEAGDAVAAFDTAEAMRAHSLRIALASHEREIARGMTDDERQAERAMASELTTLHVQRERARALAKPDQERIAKLTEAIAAATSRRALAQASLFTRLPELPVWRGLTPPAVTADLDPLVTSAGTVLMSFVADEHDVVILTATRSGPSEPVKLQAFVVAVEKPLIGERIARALTPAALESNSAWRRASEELFGLLPPSVVAQLSDANEILISPDDLLWRIPFEALPVGAGYLADRARVSYVPSVTALIRAPTRTATASTLGGAVIVGAPVIQAETARRIAVTAPTWKLRPAEEMDGEAGALGAIWKDPPAVVFAGEGATGGAIRDAATRGAAIHLGAPFRVNAASPLFSQVLLSGAPAGTTARDHLEVRELFGWETSARLVTVSDPAALSMRDSASALPSIAWAWRAAGVATVVIRRWPGPKPADVDFLSRMHQGLAEGKATDAALRSARDGLRATAAGAPTSWAGWMVIGR